MAREEVSDLKAHLVTADGAGKQIRLRGYDTPPAVLVCLLDYKGQYFYDKADQEAKSSFPVRRYRLGSMHSSTMDGMTTIYIYHEEDPESYSLLSKQAAASHAAGVKRGRLQGLKEAVQFTDGPYMNSLLEHIEKVEKE